jgi:hypothetical protein
MAEGCFGLGQSSKGGGHGWNENLPWEFQTCKNELQKLTPFY